MDIRNWWVDCPSGIMGIFSLQNSIGMIVNHNMSDDKIKMAHPNCYVGVDITDPAFNFIKGIGYNEVNIECHGGLTFAGNFAAVKTYEKVKDYWFFGWDYGHAGDCFQEYGSNVQGSLKLRSGKVYSFKEIKSELFEVCKMFDRLMQSIKYYKSEDDCKIRRVCDFCIGKKLVESDFKHVDLNKFYACLNKLGNTPIMKCDYELECVVIKN